LIQEHGLPLPSQPPFDLSHDAFTLNAFSAFLDHLQAKHLNGLHEAAYQVLVERWDRNPAERRKYRQSYAMIELQEELEEEDADEAALFTQRFLQPYVAANLYNATTMDELVAAAHLRELPEEPDAIEVADQQHPELDGLVRAWLYANTL